MTHTAKQKEHAYCTLALGLTRKHLMSVQQNVWQSPATGTVHQVTPGPADLATRELKACAACNATQMKCCRNCASAEQSVNIQMVPCVNTSGKAAHKGIRCSQAPSKHLYHRRKTERCPHLLLVFDIRHSSLFPPIL